MNELQLQQNESVLLQEDDVECSGSSKSFSGVLFLTNLNLIMLQKGAFGKIKRMEKFPLNQIKVINGQVQARYDDDSLQVSFFNRQISFDFGSHSKRTINRFIDGIICSINGVPFDNTKASSAIPGSEQIATTLKDTLGTFKDAFKGKSKNENITIKCIGCHAPLSGKKGEKIKCSYCDTEQSL